MNAVPTELLELTKGTQAVNWTAVCTAKGLLHHSDRGSQYVDADYVAALAAAGIEAAT